jgi:hypothetical protein
LHGVAGNSRGQLRQIKATGDQLSQSAALVKPNVSFASMAWLTTFLAYFLNAPEWRDIATAPFDRAIELAVIDGDISVLSFPCLRHGNSWFDAESMKPVTVAATHWRYRPPAILPFGCC